MDPRHGAWRSDFRLVGVAAYSLQAVQMTPPFALACTSWSPMWVFGSPPEARLRRTPFFLGSFDGQLRRFQPAAAASLRSTCPCWASFRSLSSMGESSAHCLVKVRANSSAPSFPSQSLSAPTPSPSAALLLRWALTLRRVKCRSLPSIARLISLQRSASTEAEERYRGGTPEEAMSMTYLQSPTYVLFAGALCTKLRSAVNSPRGTVGSQPSTAPRRYAALESPFAPLRRLLSSSTSASGNHSAQAAMRSSKLSCLLPEPSP